MLWRECVRMYCVGTLLYVDTVKYMYILLLLLFISFPVHGPSTASNRVSERMGV